MPRKVRTVKGKTNVFRNVSIPVIDIFQKGKFVGTCFTSKEAHSWCRSTNIDISVSAIRRAVKEDLITKCGLRFKRRITQKLVTLSIQPPTIPT
jgi:hypothetical protein